MTAILLVVFNLQLFSAGIVIKNFTTLDSINNSPDLTINQNASGVISQYKDIIRDQDYKLQSLQISLKKSEDEIENMKKQMSELQQTNAQLFDQNILLKAQLAATSNATTNQKRLENKTADTINPVTSSTEISFYQLENSRLVDEVKNLNLKLNEALEMTQQSLNLSEVGKLRKDQEDLLELLTDQVHIIILQLKFIQF